MKYILIALPLLISCTLASVRQPSGYESNVTEMDLAKLKMAAFKMCQTPYQAPKITPIPMLDPPNGGPEVEGMVFQEELSVRTKNILDQQDFYFSPRPRAAVNSIPMQIYVDPTNSGKYQLKTWEDAEVDYSSEMIRPPIDKNLIPSEGRVLTEIVIGHKSPANDYPQLFDLRSSAYFRFAGYPPQITGASLRLGAHNIAGLTANNQTAVEDFPVVRAVYLSVETTRVAKAFILVENGLLCGAMDMRMTEGPSGVASVLVDSFWYTREDFNWQKNPHTAFIAYSSMLWKTEKQTPDISNDEAHDSDTVRVNFHGALPPVKIDLQPIEGESVRVSDLTINHHGPVKNWILANEDRKAEHYAEFQPALGKTNYQHRASYRVDILESSIKTGVSLYEAEPDKEYKDNLVVASTIRQNIRKATSVEEAVHFKYRTTAY